MRAELSKTYKFDAGHFLPHVPAEHKCARPHGHSYRVTVFVAGEVDEQAGWVMDFGRVNEVVDPLIKQLDHASLNEIEGLSNPTSERLAKWLWDRIRPALGGLEAVTVCETDTSSCTYRGE